MSLKFPLNATRCANNCHLMQLYKFCQKSRSEASCTNRKIGGCWIFFCLKVTSHTEHERYSPIRLRAHHVNAPYVKQSLGKKFQQAAICVDKTGL